MDTIALDSLHQTNDRFSYGNELHGYVGESARFFCDQSDLHHLIGLLGEGHPDAEFIKKGKNARIFRVRWRGWDIVVKHYYHQGLLHSLRHTLKSPRASRSWRAAQRFQRLGISTPRALAYIARHKVRVVWESFLLTEFVSGPKLGDYLSGLSQEGQEVLATRLAGMLKALAAGSMTHGDLKHTNIRIADDNLYLTDLDGVRFHHMGWRYRRARYRDLARLMRDLGPDFGAELTRHLENEDKQLLGQRAWLARLQRDDCRVGRMM